MRGNHTWQDYEYFVMLKSAIARARECGVSDEQLAPAVSLLESAPNTVLGADGCRNYYWHVAKDRTQADSARIQLLQMLVDVEQLIRAGNHNIQDSP